MEKRLQQAEDDLKLVTKELEKERNEHKELSDQVNNDTAFEFSWTICCLVLLVFLLLHVVTLNYFKLQMVKVATKYKADEKVKRVTNQYVNMWLLVKCFWNSSRILFISTFTGQTGFYAATLPTAADWSFTQAESRGQCTGIIQLGGRNCPHQRTSVTAAKYHQ